ncbi:DNA-packaging protein [Halobaculum sp. CBA1158]|uniref:DNA-packaging protein n=1 Tax=Halobaculum sp. CBA1158 TaxID=2904243 RepID=UPI001F2C5613|nr:DNA-packaging protein [Halobaculum sp. CBA1158]UIP00346.1 DNA-packaging protein [Halobaculum sp. CBA1158]
MTEDEECGALKNDGERCEYTPKYPDGRCGIHTDETDTDPGGRPSKFEAVKDDLLEAADGPLNLKQVANRGGIARSTLYDYLDEHEEFSDSFKRARGTAADRLVSRALDPTDEIDTTFARFLLERSFKFIKTEKQEVELSGQGGGPIEVAINETVVETTYEDDT